MELSNTEKCLERDELWRTLNKLLQNEQDQVVLLESFVYNLAPQQILQRHADCFDDVSAIYRTKRHLLERIARVLRGEEPVE